VTSLSDGLVPLLPRLRPFAWSLTRNWPDADDLVQTSCTRALSKADQWQGGTRLDAWMYRLMRNIWIDETRKRSIRIGQGQKDAAESGKLQISSDSEKTADAGQILQQVALL
jgi:RNA polymerase sigma-70 factor (ECF subfamily)